MGAGVRPDKREVSIMESQYTSTYITCPYYKTYIRLANDPSTVALAL